VNKLSSILGAAAVLAIAVVFILQFRPATGASGVKSGPDCVAEVKGSCVSTNHFWAAYSLLSGRVGDANYLRSLNLRQKTAEGLVEQHLLSDDAKRLGVTVADDDVTAEIVSGRAHVSLPVQSIPTLGRSLGVPGDLVVPIPVKDRKSKKFDAKTAEREIRTRTRLSPAEFRDYQKDEILAERMRDLVRSRVQVGDKEAYEQYAREKTTAKLDFVRFDRRFFADLVIDSSPKAVEAWARKNQEELDKSWSSRKSQFLPECRVARHILVKVDDMAGDEAKAAARKKIEAALERVKKGEDFADVARSVSDDTSASRGGDLGCVQKGTMVKPFEEKLFSMDEGKVSDVVETEYGFHIIQLDKIAKDKDAEKIGRAQVARDLYLAHESDRLATEAAKKVQEAVRGGKSMKEALDAYLAELSPKKDEGKDKKDDKGELTFENHPQRPTVESTMPFNAQDTPIQGVQPGTDVAKIAFSMEKPGEVAGDLIPLMNGYAVAQLTEKQPATKEQWQKDREAYTANLLAKKQFDALVDYVGRLKAKTSNDVKYSQELLKEPKLKDDEAPAEAPVEE